MAQSCPALCDPMGCSTPGLPVPYHLLEFAQVHVHWISDPTQSYALPPSSPFAFNPFPVSGSFPVSHLFASGGQSSGASASASVLAMSIQGWFPLGLTGLISCSPRDSQESSPASQFESFSSSALSLLYVILLTSVHDYWKNHSLTIWTFVGKTLSLL